MIFFFFFWLIGCIYASCMQKKYAWLDSLSLKIATWDIGFSIVQKLWLCCSKNAFYLLIVGCKMHVQWVDKKITLCNLNYICPYPLSKKKKKQKLCKNLSHCLGCFYSLLHLWPPKVSWVGLFKIHIKF